MKISYTKAELIFKRPVTTSRGTLTSRPVWYLSVEKDGKTGVGECAPLLGLSSETPLEAGLMLRQICQASERYIHDPRNTIPLSSVRCAVEAALADFRHGGQGLFFPSAFTEGKKSIPTNGLIWMGDTRYVEEQIREKIAAGFRCIKMKTGGSASPAEINMLEIMRAEGGPSLNIRLDANGAFRDANALEKLEILNKFDIEVIEQPLAPGQHKLMAELCRKTPIPIALDEELTGVDTPEAKAKLLDAIRPQFLALKPSLHGGFSGCDEWIELARQRSIGWWATSYLESNIGLDAIAQWAFAKGAERHQGLGTGRLFVNNLPSSLELRGEELWRPRK